MSQKAGRFTVGVQLVSEGRNAGADAPTPTLSSQVAAALTAATIPAHDVQKSGRFTVSSRQNLESEASSSAGDTSAPNAPVDMPECSLQQLETILEAQQDIFTQTLEDMKQEVYRALLHADATRVANAALSNTPPSTLSGSNNISECQTPPCSVLAIPNLSSNNPRENTLQMWSHLGSTLQQVVLRNEELEEENRCLQADLEKLQHRVTHARHALTHRTFVASQCGPISEGKRAVQPQDATTSDVPDSARSVAARGIPS